MMWFYETMTGDMIPLLWYLYLGHVVYGGVSGGRDSALEMQWQQ